MVLTFGKHAGKELGEVPREYVEWLLESRRKDVVLYEQELERRDLLEASAGDFLDKIVAEGFRQLAKREHPDTGGSAARFAELKAAQEQLRMLLGELKAARSGG